MQAEKKRLRQLMLPVIESISARRALAAGEAISVRLADWSSWRSADAVVLFATLRGEVDSQPLIELAQREGKQLFFPRMRSGRTLEFAVVEELGSLRSGRYGVLEPDRHCSARPIPADAMVFVPGRAFDRQGGRLGRGGGYYDRALAACGDSSGRPRFIGVGFACQIVSSVPMDSLDMRMDGVVTERELFLVE